MAKIPETSQSSPQASQQPNQADNAPKSSNTSTPPRRDDVRSASSPQGDSSTPSSPGQSTSRGHTISARKGQFLIAPRKVPGILPMGMMPLQFSVVEQTLRASPDIEIVDTVGPKNIVGVLADGLGEAPGVLVTRMTEQKAAILHQQAQGRLIVEPDQSLTMHDANFQLPSMVGATLPNSGPVLATVVVVVGKDNVPIKDAEVYLLGSMLPATGVTDERGQVTLSLFGETPQSIRALYVKPKADYWSFYQQQPDISTDEANVVVLKSLSDWPSLANFPKQQVYTWGQKAMRLEQLPGTYRGQGIKVAIIDSGAAVTHDDLHNIHFGFDVINKKTNPDGWTEDTIAHGSHCAGVIVGADNALGVRGFVPDAEIHACKLFPGGQVSQLIDALEYCIEKQIDVVNLSLGGAEVSEALEQQIQRAKRAGIACIVAAGNSGGRVQYPASSPHVLAVSAIGHISEFPPDSYHTQTVTPMMDPNGFFAAKFSCYGPEVAVCAPGVAITSSVPPNNYAAWDGTSMAAPHVTGLAALVLAHHPEFQTNFKARSADRVERLFQVIRASARRINVGDPSRTGYGLPDVLAAVGLNAQAGMPALPAGAGTTQPQNAMFTAQSNTFGGMNQGNQMGGAVGQQPYASGYLEQAQFNPVTWMANSWGMGQKGGLSANNLDPFAAYRQAYFSPQQMSNQPAYAFGMQPAGFGAQQW